jgi:hypothetical protein
VVKIECGKRNSAFITNKGDLWITGNYVPEKSATAATANNSIEEAKSRGRAYSGSASTAAKIEPFDPSELSEEDRRAIMSIPGPHQALFKGTHYKKNGNSSSNLGGKGSKKKGGK